MDEDGQVFGENFGDQGIPDMMKVDVAGILLKVTFTDLPIILLVSFHAIVFLIAVLVRSHHLWRIVVFVFCMVFALISEKLGSILSENWQNFGFSDDYFDETGVFVLFFFALPPIFTCIFLLSHLIGRIGGRMIDGYVAPPQAAKVQNKAEKVAEEEEEKKSGEPAEENEAKEKTD
jgi:hypothetical protein